MGLFVITLRRSMTSYFRTNGGRVFDMCPTSYVLYDTAGDGTSTGNRDAEVNYVPVASSAAWKALCARFSLLKHHRFVQETMPGKQCICNAWVVKDEAESASMAVWTVLYWRVCLLDALTAECSLFLVLH